MRFVFVLAATAVMAAVFAGSALAIAFDDADYIWPKGEVGSSYSKQLLGRTDGGYCGNKCKFSLMSGEFPPGLSLASDGAVSGKPTRLGTFRFWIRLSGVYGGTPAEREFEVVVDSVRVQVLSSTVPAGSAGTRYTFGLQGQGTGQLTWTVDSGKLPAGLVLGSNGVISGTPTEKGTFPFVARLTDVNNPSRTDTKTYELNVLDPLKLSIGPARPIGEVGRPFRTTVKASGGKQPYTFATVELPDGLTFDAASGVVSGTPTTPGTYTIKFALADALATQSAVELKLKIVAPLTISTTDFRTLRVGRAYALKLTTTGGVRPLKWRRLTGHLPAGVSFDAKTGSLVGTPTAAGTARFTIRVRDALGATSTQRLSLTVRA